MLGKLIKHEFKETYKLFVILYSAFILLAVVSRFSLHLPFDNAVSEFIGVILNIVYFIAIFGMTFAISIIVMIRFYNKMMKDEAYLTHTVPVKTWEHIVAKITTYTIWIILGTVMMLVSLFVYFVGTEEFDTIMKYANYAVDLIKDYPSIIFSLIFAAVLCILQTIANLSMYSAALSLGQIFKKHRIIGAVVFYFALNSAFSTVSSVLMYIIPGFVDKIESYETEVVKIKSVKGLVDLHCEFANLVMVYTSVVVILIMVVSFFVTNHMLSKKLELE